MDFTLSLTHFCETHGPKSVLCTQVLPLECTVCIPPSPSLRPQASTSTLHTENDDHESHHQIPPLRKTDTNITLPTDLSGASTTVGSEPQSPNIERHPLFKNTESGPHVSPQFRYGRAQGETCASCSFSAPDSVAHSLPSGAPGSIRSDNGVKNGAPVFRSREFVCLGTSPSSTSQDEAANGGSSNGASYTTSSYASSSHPEQCHDHTLTYLTAKAPSDPDMYASLRASVIRTLSCELLPRGMSDGPLCFGDSIQGYTIAYVFRLTDPKARGRRRCYAFLALAGKDARRAFRAAPMLWEAFASMSRGIESAATRAVEEKERREEEERQLRADQASKAAMSGGRSTGASNEKMAYTPVSSFLTQRAMDPDGTMRRMGQTSPRSLADIVGDETIFAILHQYFVALLRCLGDRFGGLPLADRESVYQTITDGEGLDATRKPRRVHNERVRERASEAEPHSLREEDSTPKAWPTRSHQRTRSTKHSGSKARYQEREHADDGDLEDDIEQAKKRLSQTLSLGSTGQCAPLHVSQEAARGQLQVAPSSSRQVLV